MKQILPLFSFLFAAHCFSQTDPQGNPIFNSVTIKEETIKDFTFLSNYYTLTNNIENKISYVYISEKPNLDEIEDAAINLPSDFFVIMKKQAVLNLIMLRNIPTRQYFVVNPTTGKQRQFPCSIIGDITENRANEILKENYHRKTKIKGNILFFNNKKFTIISSDEIKKNVLEFIETHELNSDDSSLVKILSKDQLKKIVLKESKEGGNLDFFTEIKGHEYDGIQIKPGRITTKLGIALYKWGRANFDLGVNTVEDALAFWTEFKGRQANEREISYIRKGFNKEFEK